MRLKSIGTIYSPFSDLEDMPIQPASALGVIGRVVLKPEFGEGLKDLEAFSHIILLYHFHLASGYNLIVKPFLDNEPRGLFATRAPRRPNPIGLSVLRLEKIDGLTLHVSNIDIFDGTPLLDIKPFVPAFDCPPDVRIGWLSDKLDDVKGSRSDDRFLDSPLDNG
ncbi:MAG: tRNA-Thr(GGU) m(6)t(6)A37 methyltransferase TsaA [Anaerolineae bacterium SM23_ 63]|nr:MAG: tRNA-Thr(GGU) m(6)t(6)A37 methyltransferase TsaA [Anaerolineae bacterium SM23_ 63]HEY47952.1 tRNA (N6-threonylcarbamoyladenosine(37)-N6)-methyltransferase TrmO [Anaerolineae bacterium]